MQSVELQVMMARGAGSSPGLHGEDRPSSGCDHSRASRPHPVVIRRPSPTRSAPAGSGARLLPDAPDGGADLDARESLLRHRAARAIPGDEACRRLLGRHGLSPDGRGCRRGHSDHGLCRGGEPLRLAEATGVAWARRPTRPQRADAATEADTSHQQEHRREPGRRPSTPTGHGGSRSHVPPVGAGHRRGPRPWPPRGAHTRGSRCAGAWETRNPRRPLRSRRSRATGRPIGGTCCVPK